MIAELKNPDLVDAGKLLSEFMLPVEDLNTAKWFSLLGWKEEGVLRGLAGLEQCADCLLLRSVAVDSDTRGRGVAVQLVVELHRRARSGKFDSVYLLTNDAEGYFSNKLGYREINREQAPIAIKHSTQFSQLCPDSAKVMIKTWS